MIRDEVGQKRLFLYSFFFTFFTFCPKRNALLCLLSRVWLLFLLIWNMVQRPAIWEFGIWQAALAVYLNFKERGEKLLWNLVPYRLIGRSDFWRKGQKSLKNRQNFLQTFSTTSLTYFSRDNFFLFRLQSIEKVSFSFIEFKLKKTW